MGMIQSAAEVNDLAAKEDSTGDVYFVTAFSGLLAPYWDPGAAGLLIGSSFPPPYPHSCLSSDINVKIIINVYRFVIIHEPLTHRTRYTRSQRLSNTRCHRKHGARL